MCYRHSRAATLGCRRGPPEGVAGRSGLGLQGLRRGCRDPGYSSRIVVEEVRLPDATTLPRIEIAYGYVTRTVVSVPGA